MSITGHCDISYIESILEDLEDFKNVIICKSTLPPGIYKEFHKKYPNLVHAPEFLTAANANSDYENSSWVLIGGAEPYVESAKKIISSGTIKASDYHITDIATASLFKYLANTFLSTKVIFMNQIYQLANELDVSWEEIVNLTKNDSRLGNSHWQVPGPDGKFGYGGACFPKDVSALIEHARDLGIDLSLLEQVKNINLSLRDDLV
jgi:UDPglucose 6-dehydrogenase